MSRKDHVDLTVTRTFVHRPERVYDAWLSKDVASKFLFATKTGTMIHAEMDGRAGGTFRFTERRPGHDGATADVDHVGVVVAATRPHTIVLSFCAGPAPCTYDPSTATTVTITIGSEGAGSSLTLRHEGVPIAYAEKAEHGWKLLLEGLSTTLG